MADKTDEQICKCDGPAAIDLHTCPFATDINDDYTECRCCEICEQICSDDC